jgi:hypothetical protein
MWTPTGPTVAMTPAGRGAVARVHRLPMHEAQVESSDDNEPGEDGQDRGRRDGRPQSAADDPVPVCRRHAGAPGAEEAPSRWRRRRGRTAAKTSVIVGVVRHHGGRIAPALARRSCVRASRSPGGTAPPDHPQVQALLRGRGSLRYCLRHAPRRRRRPRRSAIQGMSALRGGRRGGAAGAATFGSAEP